MRIILASSSPRRKYLLGSLLANFGLKFDCVPADIEEHDERAKNFGSLVKRISALKAEAVAKKHEGLIIGADTIVVINGKIMGKPSSSREAADILESLSGRVHHVYTGLTILDSVKRKVFKTFEDSTVRFRKLRNQEIKFYIRSGSPMDKAGAYGIQDDFGCTFIEKIDGDYFNVVGLPMLKTYLGLQKFIRLKF